jgi:hypothetical protein
MSFFKPNIETKGRLLRGVTALLLLVGAIVAFRPLPWLGVALLASALFTGFEAVRGWCVLRACGIKTKL